MFEKKRQIKAIESVFPLINVIFLLIVFFLVAGHISGEKWAIQPPKSLVEDPASDVSCTVYLKEDGLRFNNLPLTKADEYKRLASQCPKGILIGANYNSKAQNMVKALTKLNPSW
ncbi:MAG: ExbD/TolR family protein [Francisellaceae bacterium]